MPNTKAIAMDKATAATMTKFVSLVGVATITPAFFHEQWITGPIVNAVFILAVVFIGLQNTLLLTLLPSTIALSVGLLPAPLAPMIPFVMVSNAVLVVAFDLLRNKNFWLGIGVAAFLKFAFLWSTSSIVIGLLLKKELAPQVAAMMSYPQFFTAILGGVIAYGLLRFLKKV